jgi:hypothetical protein
LVEILQAQTTRLQDDNARVVPRPDIGRKPGVVPEQKHGNSLLCPGCDHKNKPEEFTPGLGLWWREDDLPIDDCVPEHALVASIEIAMQRIEIEGDDVPATDRRI